MSREIVVTERIDVEVLPRRVAHAVHALMEVRHDMTVGPYGPYKPSEVVLYDSEAPTADATRSALVRAANLGLVMRVGYGLYTASFLALEHRADFEARYLRDTGGGDE